MPDQYAQSDSTIYKTELNFLNPIRLALGFKDFVITSKRQKFPNPRYFQGSLRR
ncbi:hypothetical protein AmaxDRAFT_4310 [Limnospira maxima CS-328]|uniref:Uncharacterized protein n=1 Tax=Limnospira maxima CS-328 TaxID=513049 RepID=B5W6B1_LIMMA|nr:hypothetical protein AmaxDRAFT_4310 [Limnospira maxima CS-328]